MANVLAKENEPLVRGHAAWAIGQIGGVEARLALEHARTQEKDIGVLKEIEAALKEIRAEG